MQLRVGGWGHPLPPRQGRGSGVHCGRHLADGRRGHVRGRRAAAAAKRRPGSCSPPPVVRPSQATWGAAYPAARSRGGRVQVQTENAEEGGVDPDAFNLAGWQPEQELADFILGKGPELESQLRSNVENPLPGLAGPPCPPRPARTGPASHAPLRAEEAHVRGPGGVDPRVLHTLVLSESVQSAVAAGGDADRPFKRQRPAPRPSTPTRSHSP